jgi:hypothetical protein
MRYKIDQYEVNVFTYKKSTAYICWDTAKHNKCTVEYVCHVEENRRYKKLIDRVWSSVFTLYPEFQ